MISPRNFPGVLEGQPDEMDSARSPSATSGSDGQSAVQSANSAANRMTIALACTTCRGRHLKCDGKLPCSRCKVDSSECLYVKSRRGYKGPRRAKPDRATNGAGADQSCACLSITLTDILCSLNAFFCHGRIEVQSACPYHISHALPFSTRKPSPLSSLTDHRLATMENSQQSSPPEPRYASIFQQPLPEFATGGLDLSTIPEIRQQTPENTSSFQANDDFSSQQTTNPSFDDVEISKCVSVMSLPPGLVSMNWQGPLFINAFYEHFHNCHPFILPKPQFLDLIRVQSLPHVVLAMQYMGSFYYPSASTQLAREALDNVLAQTQIKDGYYVQAMLLLAIGQQAGNEPEKASATITALGDLAVQLGMHRREYAWVNGNGAPQMEESWRRTWWELFTTYGMLAGMNFFPFRIFNVESDCLLPCEEEEYHSGVSPHPLLYRSLVDRRQNIPPPRAYDDMQDAEFMDEDAPFSSFAYRIDAIHRSGLISEAISCNTLDPVKMARADTGLANWYLQLPESKRSPIDHHGKLDEMLFQAHMIASA